MQKKDKDIIDGGKPIEDILDDLIGKLYSKDIVNQLVLPDITDFERGKVAGKIELLNKIIMELNPRAFTSLEGDEDETETI